MSHIVEIVDSPKGIPLPASYQGAKGDKGDQGEKGDSGNDGPAGSTGAKGNKGDKGDQGAQGIQGNQGPAGATGTKGDKGEKGDQGAQGVQGNQGPAGATGSKGDRGEKGDQGIQGVTGERGPTGIQGLIGSAGAKGDQGIQGIKGDKGEIGATGAVGATGAKGDQGIQGETGAAGPTGATGVTGSKGDPGIQGIQGIRGDKGETGETGSRGEKGDQGTQGAQGIQGPKGELGDAGPQGARGEKGDQGVQGIPGAQGPIGSTGSKGDKGDQGAPGIITQDLAALAENVAANQIHVAEDTQFVRENSEAVAESTPLVLAARQDVLAAQMEIQESITEGYRIIDNWNPVTNIPNLTTVTKASGDAYVLSIDATITITGTSIAAKESDIVIWNGTKWIYRIATKNVRNASVSFVSLQTDTATLLAEKRWLKDKNPASYSATILTIIKAIKSVKIIGSNSNQAGKRYSLGTLANNDTTYGYRIIIRDNVTNAQVQINEVAPTNPSGLSKRVFTITGGVSIEMVIAYSELATGLLYNSATSIIEFSPEVYLNNEENFASKTVQDSLVTDKLNVSDYNVLSVVKPIGIQKTKTWVEPTDYASKYTTLFKSNLTITQIAAQGGYYGKIMKLLTTAAGGLCRMFEPYSIIPDKTKDLYIEFDYQIVSGVWNLSGYFMNTADAGSQTLGTFNTAPFPDASKPTRKRLKYTPAQLALINDLYKINSYFSSPTINSELWISNMKVWQGDENAFNSNESDLTATQLDALKPLPAQVTQLTTDLAAKANSSDLAAKANTSDLAAKASLTDLPNAGVNRVLGISKTNEWINSQDFASKIATLSKSNATLLVGEKSDGFLGKVMKVTTTAAGGFARFFDQWTITPDVTKDLFIEFDYKTVTGAWTFKFFSLPVGGTSGAFISSMNNVLAASATVKRVRFKYTPAQLAGILSGHKIVNYVDSNTLAAEMWFGNVKVWQGDEYAVIKNEDEISTSNASSFFGTTIPEALRAFKNFLLSFVGSSVTWGDGFLQTVALKEIIYRFQKEAGDLIEQDGLTVTGTNTVLNSANDRKLFNGQGRKLTGAAASLAFNITGDELSICQLIERSNINASEIELYVDGVLYDTFNNVNISDMGTETKSFVGNGSDTKFDLGRAFTYGHAVSVNGVAKTGTLYTASATIPVGDDYMVIRKYGPNPITGAVEVHHWIWFAVAPSPGQAVSVIQSYGEEISYEKTTIGKSAAGVLENASGEGTVSYDPVNPSSLSSGMDFRETDVRSIRTWRFSSSKQKAIILKIKGIHPSGSGTPYFVFNFASSRILFFQNAGIGGWKSSAFNTNTNLCSYKQIIDFNPDVIIYESTPNDDWDVKGHRLYTNFGGLALTDFRKRRTFPAKSFTHASAVYGYQKWVGKIQAIEPTRVQILQDSDHVIDSNPVAGDVVMIGGYYSNNKEYVSRLVASYDSVNRWITFDRPIQRKDFIYSSLNQFVGMEVRVRDLSVYVNETRKLIENIKSSVPDVKIALWANPLPNLQIRELWGYPEKIDSLADISDAYTIDMDLVYKWQYSQPKAGSITVDAANLVLDTESGRMALDLAALAAGTAYFNIEVLVNGIDVYGKDAVVQVGASYIPDQTLSGNAVAFTTATSGYTTKYNQVANILKPRLEFLQNAPTSGNIVIRYSTVKWSGDSCHLANGSDGSKLFANAYISALRELIVIADKSYKKPSTVDINTVTTSQLAQLLIESGIIKKY